MATRTRIVATLGPASSSEERIGELVALGVNVFRLNMSHGSHAEHARTIEQIRRLGGDRAPAIMIDLGGTKLRLTHPVRGQPGEIVRMSFPVPVRPGDAVLLADGLMQLEVVDATHARVVVGGDIAAGKGISLPCSRVDVSAMTDKDRVDLRFAVAHGADFVALSFVGCAADVEDARASGIPVIAKVERADAVERIEEIIDAADGIMVARGDLGVEIPIERVPILQKQLIRLANQAAKPVITATQMLRSMVESRLPTRAEASDVANAVLDGTDAVMLSEETAVGQHPAEAVRVMQRIIAEAENLLPPRSSYGGDELADRIARAACALAEELRAGAIVVSTRSGSTARRIARHRPRRPIIALVADEGVGRRLSLVWGVTAVRVDWLGDTETLFERFREPLREIGIVSPGAPVVITAGWPLQLAGVTNLVHVSTL